MDIDEIYIDEWPSRTKCAEKIIQDAGELAGNPQEPMKTRSQTSNNSFSSDSALVEHYYMLIGYDPHTYEKSCNYPIWKKNNGRRVPFSPRE